MIIDREFYLRNDVVQIGQELLGTVLYTRIDGKVTSGIIVETEAYSGSIDRASHAYPDKLTKRNRIMFEEGGKAYVYLIYGIHYLFNIVTNRSNSADAVLIRAIEPLSGMETMMERRKKNSIARISSGPGILSEAMGIDKKIYGEDLTGNRVWLEYGIKDPASIEVIKTTRIGVDYANKIPYR